MDFAELQGAILEQLFSARAQQEPQEVRTQRALALAARIDELNNSFNGVRFTFHAASSPSKIVFPFPFWDLCTGSDPSD